MKKYSVYLPATAGASYEVEANSPEEAEEKACKMASLSDCEAADWDFEAGVEIEEIAE